MTVSSTINREQYATDGVTVAFTIHFPFFNDTDVNAIFVSSGGASTTFVLNTDFTVTGGDGAGGTLTCMVAPVTGGTLTIYREIPFTQEDDYVEDDPLPADTLEGGFDRAAMRDQQLLDGQDRALTLPVTISASVSGAVPEPEADTVLGWNAAGDALENKTLPSGTVVYATVANTQVGTSAAEAVTPDGLASLWQQGSNIASATTLVKPANENLGGYYLLTGNTNVAHGWAGERPGRIAKFRVVTGGFSLVNGADWINKTAGNILTVAGDTFEMIAEASDVWRMLSYDRADGSALASNNYAFSANKNNVNQTGIVSATATKLTFTTEVFDIGSGYDAANSRFIAPVAGKYVFSLAILWTGGVVDQQAYYTLIYKNGAQVLAPNSFASGTSLGAFPSAALDLAANDIIEIYVNGGGAGNKTIDGNIQYTYWNGWKVA